MGGRENEWMSERECVWVVGREHEWMNERECGWEDGREGT